MKEKIQKSWKIILALIVIVLLIAVMIISSFYTNSNRNFISYKVFYNQIQEQKIDTVVFNDDNIEYTLKNDDTKYYTTNPKSTTLYEELLLNEINVTTNDTTSTIAFVFDLIFYLFFFAIAIFAMLKFKQTTGDNFKIVKHTNVKFSDIAGMDELKKELLKNVDIMKNPAKYKSLGIRPTKGIILEGPPGNGKTLFAKALAGEANINFIATKGADFQSAMMSMGSKKIKSVFKKARRHKPCIIFIDEFDGIGERRNYAGTGVDKENNRIIIAMLNEMDGFETEDGILVIAATNSYASLDGALIRPGRFDLKFNIPNPDLNTRLKLIELYSKNKIFEDTINKEKLAECLDNACASAIESLLNEANMTSKLSGRDKIGIEDIIIASKKINIYINVKKLTK